MTLTAEQIIVGKTSFLQARVSLFAPPPSFTWLKHFSAEEIAEFFVELLNALHQGQQEKSWSFVTDVLEAWRATANVKADPVVVTGIEQGLAELEEGQGISWAELREGLGL